MTIINRAVAVIKPKQPFVDWANGLPDAEIQVTLEDFHADCLTILIPLYNVEKDGRALVEAAFAEIFEQELFDWDENQEWWPETRDLKKFRRWFDIELHSTIMDPYYEEEPIEKKFVSLAAAGGLYP